MAKFLTISGAMALLLATPAVAGDPTPGPSQLAENSEGPTNKVVCRRVEAIGTRLSSKKVCRTQAQWDAEANANRQDLERGQTQRWKSD